MTGAEFSTSGLMRPSLREEGSIRESLSVQKCSGVIGVPITFMDKYNPEQFDVVGATESEGKGFSNGLWLGGSAQATIKGIRVYKRLFIRHKKGADK